MLNIILFGPPGAGKGTQSERLINYYGLNHISTGDLLRYEISENTELGQTAKNYIDRGKLVPDEVVIGMIRNRIESQKDSNGFIFDGFPRTLAQAVELDALMAKELMTINAMIALEVPNQALIDRLVKRGETSGRSDDNIETISKRINEYEEKTKPVADYYCHQGKYYPIDGIGTIDEIFDRIKKVVNSLQPANASVSFKG